MLPFYATMLGIFTATLIAIAYGLCPHLKRVLSKRRSSALNNYDPQEEITVRNLPSIHDLLHSLKTDEERIRKYAIRCEYSCAAVAILAIIGIAIDSITHVSDFFGQYTEYITTLLNSSIVIFALIFIVYIVPAVHFLVHGILEKE